MKTKLSVKEARQLILDGKINGFDIGEVVYARRATYIFNDKPNEPGFWVNKGTHFVSDRASRSFYGIAIGENRYSLRRKDFSKVGKRVLSTW